MLDNRVRRLCVFSKSYSAKQYDVGFLFSDLFCLVDSVNNSRTANYQPKADTVSGVEGALREGRSYPY